MSDIEDDSASNRGKMNQLMREIIDRKIHSAAGKGGDLYSMRYKHGYQDNLDLTAKKIISDDHPYNLIQRQVGSVPKNIGESVPKHVGISTSIKFVGMPMPGATKEMILTKSKQSFVYSDYRTQTSNFSVSK